MEHFSVQQSLHANESIAVDTNTTVSYRTYSMSYGNRSCRYSGLKEDSAIT